MPKCAFCLHPANSREHIFSDWMLAMLPKNKRFIFNERIVKTGEWVTYLGRKVQLKVDVVCRSCNNNWMSDMENKTAKPAMKNLLFGEHKTELDEKSLRAIAVYAFKTLIIANH